MSFQTFPLFPIGPDGKCSCSRGDCEDAGKHPQIFGWKTHTGHTPVPGVGYGIATGSASGVFVVDLDGDDAVAHWKTLGTTPPTFTVRTGREELGLHLYFKLPAGLDVRNSAGRKFGHPKIDIRGEGGYVVGPTSPHASGKAYTILDKSPPADAPEWLLARLRLSGDERRLAALSAPVPIDETSPDWARRIRLAEDYLYKEAEPSVQGANGSGALWKVAQKLIRTWELPLDLAAELIEDLYNPRCTPPWEAREIMHKLEDARDIGTWMCGIPSEGWVEGLVTSQQKPRVLPPPPAVLREHNPSHRYLFTPGDRPNGDKQKISFGKAIADLVTHPHWEGVLQFDTFRRRIRAVDPPMRMDAERPDGGLSSEDGDAISVWFEVHNASTIGGDVAYRAAIQAAHRIE